MQEMSHMITNRKTKLNAQKSKTRFLHESNETNLSLYIHTTKIF